MSTRESHIRTIRKSQPHNRYIVIAANKNLDKRVKLFEADSHFRGGPFYRYHGSHYSSWNTFSSFWRGSMNLFRSWRNVHDSYDSLHLQREILYVFLLCLLIWTLCAARVYKWPEEPYFHHGGLDCSRKRFGNIIYLVKPEQRSYCEDIWNDVVRVSACGQQATFTGLVKECWNLTSARFANKQCDANGIFQNINLILKRLLLFIFDWPLVC